MSYLGNFPGKHGKKHDCLTSFNIKQQINSNLGKTAKNCAPIASTSDYDCTLLKRSAHYLVFVFLPSKKEAK